MRVQVSEIVVNVLRRDRVPLPEAGTRLKIFLLSHRAAGPFVVPEELQDSDQVDGSIDHRGARQIEFFPRLQEFHHVIYKRVDIF